MRSTSTLVWGKGWQRCVLNPRLSCCVLQSATDSWRRQNPNAGLDLRDGLDSVINAITVCAGDIFYLGNLHPRLPLFWIHCLFDLHAWNCSCLSKTRSCRVLKPSHPQHYELETAFFNVLDRDAGRKWVDIVCKNFPKAMQRCAVPFATSRRMFFGPGHWVFRDKFVSVRARSQFFQVILTSIFDKILHQQDLHAMNVEFRKLLRFRAGPLGNFFSDQPWHDVFHLGSDWATICLRHHWPFGGYAPLFPENRWVTGALTCRH